MFGAKKQQRNSRIDSLVGSHTRINGDLYFSGGLHVDGNVIGNIIAESRDSVLTTSEEGRIEGNVIVHNIILNGQVIGDVHAGHHIELASKARVEGNVYYNLIEMAVGAEVNGSLIHQSDESHNDGDLLNPIQADNDEELVESKLAQGNG